MEEKVINRISADVFFDAVNSENRFVEVDFHGEQMMIKRHLNLVEMLNYVESVANSVFNDDGSYMPEAGDYANRCALLAIYANFDLPEEVADRYAFVYSDIMSGAIETILDIIDSEQYEDMTTAIYNRRNRRLKADAEDAEKKVAEIMTALDALGEQINGIFGDMNSEDVKGLVHNLAKGVDEEKLMEAYVKAKYTETVTEDNVEGTPDPA